MTRRRPGSPWRILIHQPAQDGISHSVTDDAAFGQLSPGPHASNILVPNTEFDELVISSWFHLEQMSARQWWMSIGGVRVEIAVGPNGQPKRVVVFGPHDDGPVGGCAYQLYWHEGQAPE